MFPLSAERALSPVHDASIFRYAATHRADRIQYIRKEVGADAPS